MLCIWPKWGHCIHQMSSDHCLRWAGLSACFSGITWNVLPPLSFPPFNAAWASLRDHWWRLRTVSMWVINIFWLNWSTRRWISALKLKCWTIPPIPSSEQSSEDVTWQLNLHRSQLFSVVLSQLKSPPLMKQGQLKSKVTYELRQLQRWESAQGDEKCWESGENIK